MLTLVAVVLGGVITILAQIVLDYLRGKSQKRREQDKIKAAVRVIRLYFYAAQHVLRESLETGFWWSGAAGLDVAAAGEALPTLADLLPEEECRIYTAAWRRLRGCIQRYDSCVRKSGSKGSPMEEFTYGHSLIPQHIEPADLKFLLSTFVTVDDARQQLQPYVRDSATRPVPLRQLCLTKQEINEALKEASHLVDQNRWQGILQSSESSSLYTAGIAGSRARRAMDYPSVRAATRPALPEALSGVVLVEVFLVIVAGIGVT